MPHRHGQIDRTPGAYPRDESPTTPGVSIRETELLPAYSRFLGEEPLARDRGSLRLDKYDDETLGTDDDFANPNQGPVQPWVSDSTWSFNNLDGGHSQSMAPPTSLELNNDAEADEDLFAESGRRRGSNPESAMASVGEGSEASDRMKDFGDEDFIAAPILTMHQRASRESASPPLMGQSEDEDDLPVVELRVEDDEEVKS